MIKLRYLHLLHRWLGIGLGLFVLLWFLSGLVMLFVGYPKLTQTERLSHLAPIKLQQVKLNAAQTWAATDNIGQPEKARLAMRLQRPAYYFLQNGQWWSAWADVNGSSKITEVLAKKTAAQYENNAKSTKTLLTAPESIDTKLIDHDQWSISSSLNGHRPLYRVALDDTQGSELYISSHTGEVVLDTHRSERTWNWLGSVIHWVYFTPLRMERELWRQVVLWLAFAGVILATLGLWLGIQRARFNRRYSGDRVTPYLGWARWHHIIGLSAGVFCITWLFSGWLSLTPFGWFSDRDLSATESEHWAGSKLTTQEMRLPVALTATNIKEIEWVKFANKAYILAKNDQQEWLIDIESAKQVPPFSSATLQLQAKQLQKNAAIVSADWLTNGDVYFHQDAQKTPKVLRVTFSDSLKTSYYINAQTTEILASQDSNSRVYRWLFNGLHRMDISPLGDNLLARRITIFVLSTGGILLTVAGIVLGWRRLCRKRK
ncbi:MAG: PepSY domain-containing protein [Bacteroidia bacterium]|nr:PepSY domain-containing protein [Methylotenera sp.]